MSEWQETTLQNVVSILGDGLHGTPIYDDNGEYYFVNGKVIPPLLIAAKSRN